MGFLETPTTLDMEWKLISRVFCFNYTFRYYIAGKQLSLLAPQDALFSARGKIGSESGREICQKSGTTLRPILAQGLVISRGGWSARDEARACWPARYYTVQNTQLLRYWSVPQALLLKPLTFRKSNTHYYSVFLLSCYFLKASGIQSILKKTSSNRTP